MSPVETITEATILQGTAKGLQKAAKEAQAHKAIRSPEDAERELRVAGLLIDVSRKFAEGVLGGVGCVKRSGKSGSRGGAEERSAVHERNGSTCSSDDQLSGLQPG